MRCLSILLLALSPFCSASSAQEEALDAAAIVRAHVAARGGEEAIRAIETLVYSEGLYEEGDYRSGGSSFMAYKRPFLRLVGNPEQPGGFMEGYDGSTWEWYAEPGVVLRTVGAASEAIRHGARFEAPFVRPAEHGVTITLGEPTEVDGRPVHTLEVTLRDGASELAFIDQETFLILATRRRAPIHAFGAAVTSESRYLDYRRVGGVLFPHHFVSVDLATGEPLSEMRWGKIEANRELPDAWFSPPVYERTRLQKFLEQLYMQRSDARAVLWSYVDFRSAYPHVDTRSGVEFIGYHMLKMKSVDAAVALLAANARDYPDSASAEFELGRALETGGDLDGARWHYERALLIDPDDARAAAALEALD